MAKNNTPIQLLVVEDSASDLQVVERYLKKAGSPSFEIKSVGSLKEAMHAISKKNFDLILTDLSLSDATKLETVKAFHVKSSTVPVIVLTGSDEKRGVEAIASGAEDYLNKETLTQQVLLRTIAYTLTRHRLQKELKSKIALREEFTDMAAHELRTPMAIIKETLSLIGDGIVGSVTLKQRQYLDVAQNNMNRLIRLIDNVLDFQKMESQGLSMKKTNSSIPKILQKVFEMFSLQNGKRGLVLKADWDNRLPDVFCDADKIEEVVINFVGNALKFAKKSLSIQATQEKDRVVVSVIDDGVGIKKIDQAKLFNPFSQIAGDGNKKIKGSGLGLAISKKIIDAHKGTIGVRSTEGKGSVFYFTLPI